MRPLLTSGLLASRHVSLRTSQVSVAVVAKSSDSKY